MNQDQASQWRNFDVESGYVAPVQCRILLLEGNPSLAAFLTSRLIGQGVHVIGPFLHAPDALIALKQSDPTSALIDADIAHRRGHEDLLTELAQRRIPTVLTTGERIDAVRMRFTARSVRSKPLAGHQVGDLLRSLPMA